VAATKSLAIEYAKLGIRVNAVAPASSRRRCIPSKHMRSSPSCTRLAGWARLSEIVDAILYLESAGFVTGETIHVDGGQSAGH